MATRPDPTAALAAPAPPGQGVFLQLGRALQTGDLSAAQQAYGQIQRNAGPAAPARRLERTGSWKEAIAELEPALRKDDLSAAQLAVTPARTTRVPVQAAAGSYAALAPAPAGAPSGPALGTLLNVAL